MSEVARAKAVTPAAPSPNCWPPRQCTSQQAGLGQKTHSLHKVLQHGLPNCSHVYTWHVNMHSLVPRAIHILASSMQKTDVARQPIATLKKTMAGIPIIERSRNKVPFPPPPPH